MHKKIFLLSIPLVLSNITIPIAGMVNTALVGHLDSSSYLAAVGLGVSVVNMIIFLFAFFRMSMTGLVAQAIARNASEEVLLLICRAIILAILISLFIILSKSLAIDFVIDISKVDNAVQLLFRSFVDSTIITILFAVINYIFIGFFIAVQRTRVVLYSSMVIMFSGVLFSFLFINILGFKELGVAYSMVISNLLTMLYLFFAFIYYILHNKVFIIKPIDYKKLFVVREYVPFLKINTNIFVRSICLLVSINSFYVLSSYYGKGVLAANIILVEVGLFVALFLDALANVTETLVAESYVKENRENFYEVVYKTLVQCVLVSFVLMVIYALLHKEIISWFTSIDSVRLEVNKYIAFSIVLPFIASASFWIDGIFIGTLKTVAMRNAMILTAICYFVTVWLLSPFGNYGLWMSLLAFYIYRTMFLALTLVKIMKRKV